MKTQDTIILIALILVTAGLSCNKSEPAKAAAVAPAKPEEHGEGAEAKELSDLDRPVEELLAMTCEHGKKTFECDECRYETGFVRVPACLCEGGLVKTVEVESRKVAVPLELTGEVGFDERRVGHVSSQVEGIVKKVHVALGDKVVTGQALIEIESVEVGESQADYLEAEALVELARRNFERVSELRKENISSEKEYLEAKHELGAAEIRARGASGKLRRLGTGGNNLGRLVLRAPMDGTVLVMHAVPGEVAKTEESLITLGDNTTLWVWADLYERDIAAVNKGHAAQNLDASVSVKAYPGDEFPGTVDLVGPAMDESSRTVKVRVEVANPDGRLLAGMFAAVKVFLPGMNEVPAVPRSAVLEDEGRTFVFVHHHGEYYVRRPVVVGRTWDGWVEIKKGLAPGQTAVADGAFLMKSDVLRSKMGAGCAD
ncbi:MAG: efflux RND transporter periplasmic adaptor subunit [Deltaproteobacteria bacterium]|nr:efflux RND transporter periplasmic adaptor subunit [Deltaproteobacteria bacterium]